MTLSAGPVTVVVTVDREMIRGLLREEWPLVVTVVCSSLAAVIAGAVIAYLL